MGEPETLSHQLEARHPRRTKSKEEGLRQAPRVQERSFEILSFGHGQVPVLLLDLSRRASSD